MDIKTFAKEHFEEYKALICQLTAIPAPSHHEERRAAFICEYLHQLGYGQAFIDDAKNVICEVKGSDLEAPVHIFMAHTDTVFPDETEIPVVVEDGCIKAPGVGDDTTNVCAILMTLKYLSEKKIVPKQTMVFALNSCEEGLGNLKGCRALVKQYTGRIGQLVSYDCGYNAGTVWAVGSRRYEIRIRTTGGHSYADFGATNAIAVAADMIHDFYEIDTNTMPGKTTYNVGLIEGGTSVNTIAQDVKILYEYRSDRMMGLELMEREMSVIVDKYTDREDARVDIEMIGDRAFYGSGRQKENDGAAEAGRRDYFQKYRCDADVRKWIYRLQYSVVHGHTGHLLRRLSGRWTAYKRRICPNRFTGNRPVRSHGNDLRGYDEPAVGKSWFLIDG